MKYLIGRSIGVPDGSSLQGYLPPGTTYAQLVEVLGPPSDDGDGWKVDAEWLLLFEDGQVATIYNYKTGPNYNDGAGRIEDVTDWHIGGLDANIVERVQEIFG
jgi:hypothetical protein